MINAEYWQQNRPLSAKGSGVAKALKFWKKSGCEAGYPDKGSQTHKFFEEATKACADLETAFATATKKCRKEKKDTAKRDRTLKIIADSQKELARFQKAVADGFADYKVRLERFEKARADLAVCGAKLAKDTDAVYKKAYNLDKRIREIEKKVKAESKGGKLPPAKIRQAAQKLLTIIQEAKKYDADVKAVFDSPAGRQYAALKSDNPGHHDVTTADTQRYTKAFAHMERAATNYKQANDNKKRTADRCDSVARSARELFDAFNSGAKSLEKSLEDAKKLAAESKDMHTEYAKSHKKFAGICDRVLATAQSIAKGKVIQQYRDSTNEENWLHTQSSLYGERNLYDDVSKEHARTFDTYKRFATRGMKRIPASAKDNPQISKIIDKVSANYESAKAEWENLQRSTMDKYIKSAAKANKVCKDKLAKINKKSKKKSK